ncbi:MAG: GNAT family N-acetyltransferase [Novosphingobium sp.]
MDRTIIRLGACHVEQATATLVAAFMDDPAMCWMFPDPAVRARRLPGLMRWSVIDHLRHGMVLGTAGAEAVTLWRPPGAVHEHAPLTPPMLVRFLAMLGTAVLRAERLDRMISRHLPAGEAQFYLRMAGVHPLWQGKGLGGLAIRSGLAEAEAAGLPQVLETAKEGNVGIYRALGFEVIDTWRVAGNGPLFWTMQREAAPQARASTSSLAPSSTISR